MDFNDGGIYAPGPIKAVVSIGQNIAPQTDVYHYFRVRFIEPMPESAALEIEAITLSGATTLAANGILQKQAVPALRVRINEMLHLRWRPLDNVEGILWQYPTDGRFATQNVQSRVTRDTENYDPYLSTTTFWLVGQTGQEDLMNLEVRNPMGVATPTARFRFWGFRYLLTPLNLPAGMEGVLEQGDPEAAREAFKAVTFLPARGIGA